MHDTRKLLFWLSLYRHGASITWLWVSLCPSVGLFKVGSTVTEQLPPVEKYQKAKCALSLNCKAPRKVLGKRFVVWNSHNFFFFFYFKGPSKLALHPLFAWSDALIPGKGICSLFICHFLASSHRPKRGREGGKECRIQSSHHNSLQCMSGTWLIHRLLMAAHNQAPRLSTQGSGHTLKNPLEMSSPFQLSTLITLKQRVRGCFISFYAAVPVFAHSFLCVWFHTVKRHPKSPLL